MRGQLHVDEGRRRGPGTMLQWLALSFSVQNLGIGRGFVTCRGRGKGSPGVRVGVGNFVPSKNPYPQCGFQVFGGFFGGYEIQRKCDFILIF